MGLRAVEMSLLGRKIRLELFPKVFVPTTTTRMLVDQLGNLRGKTVLDLGCGSGPIAIAAAFCGARTVYAVDIMREACEATRRNAELNGVAKQVEVRQGDLFEPVKDMRFDVIVSDVSGMAEEVARISPWYWEPILTGGRDGTALTARMLGESRGHLKSGGHLLFPVLGLARSEKILSVAREIFAQGVHKLAERMIPFCKELKDNIQLLERLKEEGIIQYVKKRSHYLWSLAVYRTEV